MRPEAVYHDGDLDTEGEARTVRVFKDGKMSVEYRTTIVGRHNNRILSSPPGYVWPVEVEDEAERLGWVRSLEKHPGVRVTRNGRRVDE